MNITRASWNHEYDFEGQLLPHRPRRHGLVLGFVWPTTGRACMAIVDPDGWPREKPVMISLTDEGTDIGVERGVSSLYPTGRSGR